MPELVAEELKRRRNKPRRVYFSPSSDAFQYLPQVQDVPLRTMKVLLEAGIALRGLFLIDKDGVVQHQVVNNLPLGRSVDEALRMVKALQFFEANGEVYRVK